MAFDNIIPFGGKVVGSSYDAAKERIQNIVGKKIAEARKQHGYSQRYMVEALHDMGVDISVKTISKWENGETIANVYQIIAVAAILDLSEFRELMYSYHPMLNDEGMQKVDIYRDDLIASGKYAFKPISDPEEYIATRKMRFSKEPVSAGLGVYLLDDNIEWRDIPENLIPRGAQFAVPITGNSMEPEYHNGEYVWVRPTEAIAPNDIGIFDYDGSGFLKKYGEQEPAETEIEDFTDSYGVVHPQPVLYSLNRDYEPIVISSHRDFSVIGVVVGKYVLEDDT